MAGKRGRPTKKTQAAMDTIVKAVGAYDHSLEEAADLAGVGRTTVYEWMDNDPAFSERVSRARASLRAVIKATVLRVALGPRNEDGTYNGGDPSTLRFVAANMAGMRASDNEGARGGGNIILVSNVPKQETPQLASGMEVQADSEAG